MVVIRPIESKVMDGGGWWPTRPLGSHRPCCDRLFDEMLDGFLPVRARSSHSGNRLGKKNKISKRKFLEANSQINSQRSDDYLANVFFQEKGARHRSWLNDWRIFIYFLNCSYTPCMDTKIATCVFSSFFSIWFYLGGFDAGGDIPARVRSIKFSLSDAISFLIWKQKKFVVHRVNQFSFLC